MAVKLNLLPLISKRKKVLVTAENPPKTQTFEKHCTNISTVVPGFRALGFSALPGFRALKACNGAWSVHKTLFGFRAPLSQLFV